VAYNLGAYQTPDLGYELSETRTDDQSGIKLGLTYYLSKQVSFKVNYEHLSNTVFFTKDFYESNTGSIGMKVKF
jgi:predicted porin